MFRLELQVQTSTSVKAETMPQTKPSPGHHTNIKA